MELRSFMLRHFQLGIAALFALGLSQTGCVSAYQNPNLPNLTPSSEYFSMVDDNTGLKKVYDGFNETMEMSATLMTTKLSHAQLDHKARMFQWTPEQYATNKAELETNLNSQTKIFLSFYVPERKQDDLHKPATLWKIFLDAGGKRYEGHAARMKTILADVQSLYPKHTRFSTPYMITFSVPVSRIENVDSKLTITGPVSSASVDFKAAP